MFSHIFKMKVPQQPTFVPEGDGCVYTQHSYRFIVLGRKVKVVVNV